MGIQTRLFLLIIIIGISACSNKTPDPEAVKTAIAMIEAANPTVTPIPHTYTPTITKSPTSTTTPSLTPTNKPTITRTVTITPTPRVPLWRLLITINDFGPMSDFYNDNPILKYQPSDSTTTITLDSCEETFTAKDSEFGEVSINLMRYASFNKAKEVNEAIKYVMLIINTDFLKTTTPDNFWVGADLRNGIWASATRNEIVILVLIQNKLTEKTEDFAGFALMLIKNQILRLEGGGY